MLSTEAQNSSILRLSPPQPHRMSETDVWMFNAVKFVFNIFFLPFNCCLLLILSLIDRCYARSVSELYSMNQILLTFLIVPAQMFCGFCGKAKLSWASHRSLVLPRRSTNPLPPFHHRCVWAHNKNWICYRFKTSKSAYELRHFIHISLISLSFM